MLRSPLPLARSLAQEAQTARGEALRQGERVAARDTEITARTAERDKLAGELKDLRQKYREGVLKVFQWRLGCFSGILVVFRRCRRCAARRCGRASVSWGDHRAHGRARQARRGVEGLASEVRRTPKTQFEAGEEISTRGKAPCTSGKSIE